MDGSDLSDLTQMLARGEYSNLVSSRDQVMLDYVAKLTLTPQAITNLDVQKLRVAGFDDRGIHDICAIAAYFAFVNRIADGLGVQLEERFTDNSF